MNDQVLNAVCAGIDSQIERVAKNMTRAIAEIDRQRAINAELLAAAKLAIGLYGGPPLYFRFDQLKAVIKRAEEEQ